MPEKLRQELMHVQSKWQQSQPYEDGPSSVWWVILPCEHMGAIRKSIRNRKMSVRILDSTRVPP